MLSSSRTGSQFASLLANPPRENFGWFLRWLYRHDPGFLVIVVGALLTLLFLNSFGQ